MSQVPLPTESEVDLLLRNAQLRDELEPYLDESIDLVTLRQMSLVEENDFLASILAWERAPTLPISQWFEPEMVLPNPDTLTDDDVHDILWQTIGALYEHRIVLDLTDHLSDRQLYCLIARDILPSYEKRLSDHGNFLHWHCLQENDMDCWLRYYASEYERIQWQHETGSDLPPKSSPPYPREMPRRSSHF